MLRYGAKPSRFFAILWNHDTNQRVRTGYLALGHAQRTKTDSVAFVLSEEQRPKLSEIRILVREKGIRGAREWRQFIKPAHLAKELSHLPVELDKYFGLKWSQILFKNQKFIDYSLAVLFCRNNQIETAAGFDSLTREERAKNHLPTRMTYYKEFPGWAVLRKELIPNLELLKQILYREKIYSRGKYLEFATSKSGTSWRAPKNPPIAYGASWRGWDYILVSREVLEREEILARMRASREASKVGR
jgi:hypothetical protein